VVSRVDYYSSMVWRSVGLGLGAVACDDFVLWFVVRGCRNEVSSLSPFSF
jgi:hypothetical protein